MSLTDLAIRKLKPDLKPRKYADGEGLFLYVHNTGTKTWRFRYRNIVGIQGEITLGKYPALSLLEARLQKDEAKKLLMQRKDPNAERKELRRLEKYKNRNSFAAVAEEWFELNKDKWTHNYSIKVWNRLEKYVFPVIGWKQIDEISGLEILDEIIRKIERKGHTETAHKLLQNCAGIFRLAFLTKRAPFNPLTDLRGVLKPHKTKSFPTIKINEFPQFIGLLEASDTYMLNKLAIKMLVLTFVRQGELRKAKWEHFDFDRKLWCIPAEMMKTRQEHIVPLSEQVIELLEQLRHLSGSGEYLFPTRNPVKYPYMNENVINGVIYKLGYRGKLVAHGFRSLASTTLNELGFSPDVIEKQLAHSERNQVRAAYNRAVYLPQRTEMMQKWLIILIQ